MSAKFKHYDTIYLDDGDKETEINIVANCRQYYDGIGPYEFWGYKGFDKGHLRVEIENIRPVFKTADTDQFREYVLKYIREHYTEIESDLYNNENLYRDGEPIEDNYDYPSDYLM